MTDDPNAEAELVERFRDYYTSTARGALRELERRALGAAYGGNGYTDVDQVSQFIELLGIGPGDRVLEIGSGAGWPGLYLAKQSGCRVVLSDIPWEGLAWGRRMGQGEAIDVDAVACSGVALPFRDGSFDAVTHSDVLC